MCKSCEKCEMCIDQQLVRLVIVSLSYYKEHCQYMNKTSPHDIIFNKKWIHNINVLMTIFKQLDSELEPDEKYILEVR